MKITHCSYCGNYFGLWVHFLCFPIPAIMFLMSPAHPSTARPHSLAPFVCTFPQPCHTSQCAQPTAPCHHCHCHPLGPTQPSLLFLVHLALYHPCHEKACTWVHPPVQAVQATPHPPPHAAGSCSTCGGARPHCSGATILQRVAHAHMGHVCIGVWG